MNPLEGNQKADGLQHGDLHLPEFRERCFVDDRRNFEIY